MTREEIIEAFRLECPEITERVVTDPLLHVWCKQGNREVCAEARCIVDKDGTTISTSENDQKWDLTREITNFYDIDDYPGGGVTYNSKRLTEKTMAQLDEESITWRNRSSGTPKAYYRRGKWLWLDRAIDSNADDVTIYSVLLPDDFDDDDKTPYNELTYLKPFHYAIVKYLEWKAKQKIGKREDSMKAHAEFLDFIKWMKKQLGGGKYAPIHFRPRIYPS